LIIFENEDKDSLLLKAYENFHTMHLETEYQYHEAFNKKDTPPQSLSHLSFSENSQTKQTVHKSVNLLIYEKDNHIHLMIGKSNIFNSNYSLLPFV
jgi:hypothetical protein